MIDSASSGPEREIDELRRRIAQLEAIQARRLNIERDLARRIELERLLSDISQGFIHCKPDGYAEQIGRALERLAAFAGAARAGVCTFADDRSGLRTIRGWQAPGIDAVPPDPSLPAAELDALSRGALVRTEAQEGSGNAAAAVPGAGVTARLAAPMMSGDAVFGALVLEAFHRPKTWRDSDITLARAVADIVSNVLARSRVEHEIRQLNRELDERVRSRTAALQASLRELESFSYSVSHDLRSPLRAINGYSHLLLEDYGPALDDTARSYLSRIRAATERMGSLIDDLLNLSRISRAQTESSRVAVSSIASDILRELAAADPLREVVTRIEPDLYARGDASLLRVALENLLGNAWKFTGRRSPARIELGIADTAQGRAFYVRDDGSGFDPAYAGRLFEPFQRLHEADQFPGSGIGLATVKRIIDRHGGSVWAHGEPGGGATFYFTLPEP